MGSKKEFHRVIEAILKDDKRYAVGAYVFVRMALDYTVRKSVPNRTKDRKGSHVSAAELVDGIRCFALETFGPMAAVLFLDWGVKECADFGDIVFNMIKVGEMSKTDDDKLEDFAGHYDFYDAFERPFLPKSKGGM
jgi:uncharacterized repeat protein (TIGR04138 family)